ncbi:Rpn family recombination-promoting nuclease/putative transposase [Fibrobacter sp.]|uniref:Rpn family recombination-promoting nuclease/putative transposase n=1 Tax=Fibrobacter sp. TaxID=35828 RepID=UPI00388D1383
MNRTQHLAMLEAMRIDSKNLLKYQQIYKFAYLLCDGVFKIVFAEEKGHSLLISLLNAMLDLHDGDAIKSISLEMQEYPGIFTKKDCILDIIGTTNAGEKVLVEVQQKKDKFFKDRVQYYLSRVIENQVHTSEKYELPRIYFLGLLDFEMFPEEPAEYIHHVDEMCHGKKFFPKIQKVFVEIDKFFELENAGTTKDDHSDAAQWLRAIKAIVKEESAPEKILQNETFQKLMDSVKLINFAEELFNVEVKNMTDLQAEHEEGLAEGRELGFAEGKAEGFAEGKAEGYADGKTEGFAAGEKAERAKADKEKREIAKGLREDGVPMDVIIRRTGFSKEEIESL